MELGASIFVKANKNLYRASEEFNLSLIDFEGETGELGIWDGTEFRFRVSRDCQRSFGAHSLSRQPRRVVDSAGGIRPGCCGDMVSMLHGAHSLCLYAFSSV